MKKKANRILILLILLLPSVNLVSQDESGNWESVVIPSPPEAGNLIGQLRFPVDYNTGLASLEIPIYEIKLNNIVIPIKLIYTSSGFKPQEYSVAGTGWSFMAEPQIARKINGLPDEIYYYSKTGNSFYVYPEFSQYHTILYGINDKDNFLDYLPDQFFYRLPKRSGSFFTKRDIYKLDNKFYRDFITVPHEAIKVSGSDDLSNLVITDIDGTVYTFCGQERTDRMSKGGYISYYSCYKSSSIKTILGEEVTFSYDSPQMDYALYNYDHSAQLDILQCVSRTIEGTGDIVPIDPIGYGSNYGSMNPAYPESGNYSRNKYYNHLIKYISVKPDNSNTIYHVARGDGKNPNSLIKMYSKDLRHTSADQWSQSSNINYVSSIKFPGGNISLSYTGSLITRSDIMLNEIIVKNESGEILKWVKLIMNFSDWGRPRLDKVLFLDRQGNIFADYSMEYSNKNGMFIKSYGYKDARVNSWGYAWESYYRGKEVPSLLLTESFISPGLSSANQITDTLKFKLGGNIDYYYTSPKTHPQASMLKKITFPTGGSSVLEYEPAYFLHSLRKQIVYTGCQRIKSISSYNLIGKLSNRRVFKYGKGESGLGIGVQPLKDEDFMSSEIVRRFQYIISNLGGIGYWERQYDLLKYSISSTPLIDDCLGSSASVVYDYVTEYIEDGGENSIGKTEYKYDYSNIDDVRAIRMEDWAPILNVKPTRLIRGSYLSKYKGWSTGQLKDIIVYKKQGELYIPSSKTSYKYNSKSGEIIPQLIIYPLHNPQYGNSPCPYFDTKVNYIMGRCYSSPGVSFIQRGDGAIQSGTKLITEKKETQYSNLGEISEVTEYKYNEALMPIEITTYGSNNEKQQQRNKYCTDFTDDISKEMVEKNMINRVIKEELYRNNTLFYKECFFYKKENNLILPWYIENTWENGNFIQEVVFDKYDIYGNLQSIITKDNRKITYLWAYGINNSRPLYPVMKIDGLSYEAVKSRIGEKNISDLGKCHQENTILGLQQTIRSILNNEKDIFIYTYIYKPLVGLMSETNPQGITTYYNYDDSNRLKEIYIKDEGIEKKIIQSYHYQYK